ncbi:MAG TPA: PEGA domain-containing protein, partial [Polyangia bacterium]|nr:PEGA domain-containing protein [Polyangia bacterium]
GKPLFADVPVRERVLMRADEKAVVQYGCDGERFAVSVRDAFGTLRKETILAYLDKCLHASGADQIDRKAGGAGLGLYLIANSATEVYFHVFEGAATEVLCSFDLTAARSQLRVFGVFEESIATAARPSSAPPRTMVPRQGRRREDHQPPPRASMLLPVMMTFAVLLLITAVTLVALPYVRHAATAALRVETDPPGATVYVDGRARGTAPLTVAGLEAGRSYAVRSTLQGHKEDEELVTAASGESTIRLRLPAEAAGVAVESDPPGARVLLDGKDTGKLTPAALELDAGRAAEVTLKRDGFLDQQLHVVAPGAGERAVYRASLPLSTEVAALSIETVPPNAGVTVDGLALFPPAAVHDTFVKPGARHVVKASAPGFVEAREEVTLGGGQHRALKLVLVEGGQLSLKSNVSAKVFIDDKAVGTAPMAVVALPEGRHTLALRASEPPLDYQTSFTIERGQTVEEKLDFGTVEVKAPGVLAHPAGAEGPGVTTFQALAGARKVVLSNRDTGEKREREINVPAGKKLVIDAW